MKMIYNHQRFVRIIIRHCPTVLSCLDLKRCLSPPGVWCLICRDLDQDLTFNSVFILSPSALQSVRRPSLTPPSPSTICWEEYINADNGRWVKNSTNSFKRQGGGQCGGGTCFHKRWRWNVRFGSWSHTVAGVSCGFRAPHLGRELICKESKKNFKATIAMSQDFPLGIESWVQFFTLLMRTTVVRPWSNWQTSQSCFSDDDLNLSLMFFILIVCLLLCFKA